MRRTPASGIQHQTSTAGLKTVWAIAPEELELPRDEVHVWRVSLSRGPSDVGYLRTLLARDELDRALRFHFERDRSRFIAARGTLRKILGNYLKLAPEQIAFSYSSHGKPCLSVQNGLGSLRFNVAHSRDLALLAFTNDREIGVDLEYIRSDYADDDIADRYFAPAELTYLRSLPAADRVRPFFQCWTRKEAYIKAKGEGLSLALDSFDVSETSADARLTLNVYGLPTETDRWLLVDLNPGDGYAGAIAVEGQFGLRIREFDFQLP